MGRKPTVGVVAARGYWRESTARVMVDAWRGSGETVAAFARRHGVDRRRLARWVRRVEGTTQTGEVVVPFHPVRVVGGAAARGTEAPIEIAVGRAYQVRVPPGFAGEDLRRVLAVLGVGGAC
jgi:hypothetical protein